MKRRGNLQQNGGGTVALLAVRVEDLLHRTPRKPRRRHHADFSERASWREKANRQTNKEVQSTEVQREGTRWGRNTHTPNVKLEGTVGLELAVHELAWLVMSKELQWHGGSAGGRERAWEVPRAHIRDTLRLALVAGGAP